MKATYPHLPKLDLPSFPIETSHSLPELALVEAKLEKVLGESPGSTQKIGGYLLKAGGKRIRPLLTCLSGRLLGARSEDVVTCAAAIELIHMASLVHDDVIDKSDIRRGQPSVNSFWGNHVAVLTGDFLFAKAFQLLSTTQLLPVLQLVVEAIDAMCNGEIEQALAKGQLEQSQQQYLDRIDKKTGKLIAASCSVGPLLVKAAPGQLFALQNYGTCIGYAFQIVDDLLDFQGDAKSLGKPIGLDLEQGFLTLPLLQLLEHSRYRLRTKELLSQMPLTPTQAEEIYHLLKASGVLVTTRLQAQEFIELAKQQLAVFETSWPITAMSLLADYVLDRIN